MTAAEFQAKVEELIRTIEDPVELQRKLTELVQSRFPVPVFAAGERMPMHEFERRFKKHFCGGIEPRYAQWPVTVIVDGGNGELMVSLGVLADGAPIGADSDAQDSALRTQD